MDPPESMFREQSSSPRLSSSAPVYDDESSSISSSDQLPQFGSSSFSHSPIATHILQNSTFSPSPALFSRSASETDVGSEVERVSVNSTWTQVDSQLDLHSFSSPNNQNQNGHTIHHNSHHHIHHDHRDGRTISQPQLTPHQLSNDIRRASTPASMEVPKNWAESPLTPISPPKILPQPFFLQPRSSVVLSAAEVKERKKLRQRLARYCEMLQDAVEQRAIAAQNCLLAEKTLTTRATQGFQELKRIMVTGLIPVYRQIQHLRLCRIQLQREMAVKSVILLKVKKTEAAALLDDPLGLCGGIPADFFLTVALVYQRNYQIEEAALLDEALKLKHRRQERRYLDLSRSLMQGQDQAERSLR
jgi:hypothetical protein